MMSPVIDFRARPNTPEWAHYLARRASVIRSHTGTTFGSYHAPEETIEEFVAQLDRAGIDRAVFAARNRSSSDPQWTLTNDFVAECVRGFPDRIVGCGGIDAADPDQAAKGGSSSSHRTRLAGRVLRSLRA
jgi:hypothetical protein